MGLMDEPALPFALAGIFFVLLSPQLGIALLGLFALWIAVSSLKDGLKL